MTFIEPSAEIIATNSDKPLQLIEQCARTCYQSQDRITEGSADRMVKTLLKNGHLAMLEHLVITMRLDTSRSVTHELVRHRLASYAERSTRYCDSKDMVICTPAWGKGEDFNKFYNIWNHGLAYMSVPPTSFLYIYFITLQNTEELYNKMLERGATKQQARGILPNDLATEIVVTANAREWMHILELRTAKDAHPDMQLLMNKVKNLLKDYCPIIFG